MLRFSPGGESMPANQRFMSLSSLRHNIALFHCLESVDFHLLEKRLVRRRYLRIDDGTMEILNRERPAQKARALSGI